MLSNFQPLIFTKALQFNVKITFYQVDKRMNCHRERFGKLTFQAFAFLQSDVSLESNNFFGKLRCLPNSLYELRMYKEIVTVY